MKKMKEKLINGMQCKCNIVLDKKIVYKMERATDYSKHGKECILKSRAKKADI